MAIVYARSVSASGSEEKGLSPVGPASSSSEWAPPALSHWLAQPDPAPRWLLRGLLPADSIIITSGKAKLSKKTWLAFAITLAIASGQTIGPLIPEDTAGLPTLVLEAEGSSPFTKDRWRMLGAGTGIDVSKVSNIYFAHRNPILLNDKEWVARIREFVRSRGIKFVVVDPLVSFMRGNENDVDAVSEILRALISIRETGASVNLLHHLSKPQKDYTRDIDDDLRGSSAIPGAYDQHWALRQRGTGKATDLTVRFKDGAEEKKFEVSWFIGNGSASFDMLPCEGPEFLLRKADELMTIMAGGEEATANRIGEMLGLEDPIELLDSLLNDGRLVKAGRNYRIG